MSQTIRVLDEKTINQIKAGEVIENVSSVIKELVDNAIDAKATHIQITVRASGLQSIVVQDNGHGMTKEDLLVCLERHATSKLKRESDLWSLSTMGFRGEALSAIHAVSRMTILTCLNDGSNSPIADGHFLKAEGAKIISCSQTKGLFGTKVEVEDLFYNVPARRKFLQSMQKEERQIFKTVMLLALCRPDIGFELIINGKKELAVSPETYTDRIKNLLGTKTFSEYVSISYENESLKVHGFISKPTYSKPNRMQQYLFINDRPVTSLKVSQWIKQGYGSSIEDTRHPSFILFFDLQKDLVDVNVHPQKKEVRFSNELELSASCVELVRKALFLTPATAFEKPEPTIAPSTYHYSFGQKPMQVFAEERPFEEPETPPELFQVQVPTIIGIFDPYILAYAKEVSSMPIELDKDGLLFIHSRLAQARVYYEESLKNVHSVQSQQLITPHFIEMSIANARVIRAILEEFIQEGIHIREFGENAFLIEAVPSYLESIDLDEFFHHVAEAHDQKQSFLEQKRLFMKQLARFSSTSPLSTEFGQILVKKLFMCDDPYHCPNGKKTMFTITRETLLQNG